jgi:hypothetical protein
MTPATRCRKGAHPALSPGTEERRVPAERVVSPDVGEWAEEHTYCTQVRPTFSTRSVSVRHVTDCPRRLPGATSAETSPWRSNTIRCRWMLAGWTPIRSASSSAVRPRSEICRRISVRTLLPMVSIASSTSFGMSTGIDRRGIGVIVPDGVAVALSARECKYRGLKDADRTDQGRHPVGARAPQSRGGFSAGCAALNPWPPAVGPVAPRSLGSPAEPVRASHLVIARPDLFPGSRARGWRSPR